MAKEPPLTARETKERWTELMEKRTAFYPRQGGKQAAGPGNGGGRGGAAAVAGNEAVAASSPEAAP